MWKTIFLNGKIWLIKKEAFSLKKRQLVVCKEKAAYKGGLENCFEKPRFLKKLKSSNFLCNFMQIIFNIAI